MIFKKAKLKEGFDNQTFDAPDGYGK